MANPGNVNSFVGYKFTTQSKAQFQKFTFIVTNPHTLSSHDVKLHFLEPGKSDEHLKVLLVHLTGSHPQCLSIECLQKRSRFPTEPEAKIWSLFSPNSAVGVEVGPQVSFNHLTLSLPAGDPLCGRGRVYVTVRAMQI